MAIELTLFESGFRDKDGNIIKRADLQHVFSSEGLLELDGRDLNKEELEKKVDEAVGKNRESYYVAKGDSGFYIVYRHRKLK